MPDEQDERHVQITVEEADRVDREIRELKLEKEALHDLFQKLATADHRTPLGDRDAALVKDPEGRCWIVPSDLAETFHRWRDALEKLSVLGNGQNPGNSDGNVIAQKALASSNPA